MSNDAEWDDLDKVMTDDKPMVLYEITGEMDVKDHLVFMQGIAAQRLKYLKEAAKVMKILANALGCKTTFSEYDRALKLSQEFILAWGDDDDAGRT